VLGAQLVVDSAVATHALRQPQDSVVSDKGSRRAGSGGEGGSGAVQQHVFPMCQHQSNELTNFSNFCK